MNLDQYPRSKRFIEDSGYINESDLSEVQDEFTQSKDVLAVEKGKLTRARNNQDSKSFYSEMEKILERIQYAQVPIPSEPMAQRSSLLNMGNDKTQQTRFEGAAVSETERSGSGPVQSLTKGNVGPLFGRSASIQRQPIGTNSNLTLFATLIVMLLFAWRLFNAGEDIYVIITLSVSLSMIVPLFIAEVLKKSGTEDLLLFISSMGWIGIALASQIGLEWENSTNVSKVFFATELESILVPLLLAFSVFSMPASWDYSKSSRLLQNPWSMPIFGAVLLNAICMFIPIMSVEHLGNITVTFVSYGAVLSLFHDRRSPVVALVVLMLIFRPLLLAESALSSLFLPLVFIPLLVWFVSYAASDARLIKHRTLIVLTAIALHGIMNLMQSNSIQEFTLQLTLWLGFAVLAEAHHQNNSPAEHTVLKILDPTSEKISEKVVLERIVAVIGSPASGKSCYLGGLWTLLRDPISRELWYGSAKYLNDDRNLPFAVQDIQKLLASTENGNSSFPIDEKDLLQSYLAHRSADFTMLKERESGVLPPTSTPFPFEVTAKPQTRRFLNEYMSRLGNDDLEQRKNLVPTVDVNTDLEIKLEFCAEVESERSILFGLFKSSKRTNQKVKTSFRTLDMPGEDYRATLDRLDGMELTSNSLDEMLARILSWGDEDARDAVEYVVKLIGYSHDVLLLIDSDSFTSRNSTARNEVNAFIRLSDQIAGLKGANTGHVSCLLNKADILIHRGDSKNRMMKNGSLEDWSQLMDQDHALETLIENIGEAQYHQLSNIDVDAYYACTLGGLISGSDEEYSGIPPYPMVPINVFEPLLRCLLPRN
tara:strand:+ start:11133 stop:13598 length:2466 start_codon:yes stop_codon:yes gene_type:complete